MDDEQNLGRRDFLNWSWKVLGVGLAVEAAWTTHDILAPRSSDAFGGEIAAGSVNEFPEGTVRYFLDGRFYVTSYRGSLYALYQRCPHLGCRVPFCGDSAQFECPCHGSGFNIKGEYLDGPAPDGGRARGWSPPRWPGSPRDGPVLDPGGGGLRRRGHRFDRGGTRQRHPDGAERTVGAILPVRGRCGYR